MEKHQSSKGSKFQKFITASFLIVCVFVVSGCVINLGLSSNKNNNDSGFFASYDKGQTWIQKSELASVGGQRAFFNNVQSNFLKLDPSDPKAFYLGTNEDGLFYSYNKGDSWQKTLTGKGSIHDLAVDPKYSCTIYIAVGNALYKSIDCLRHSTVIHYESGRYIASVAVDGTNNNKIYLGLSDGVILKSENSGAEWLNIAPIPTPSSIIKILVNPNDSKKVYVVTRDKGIFRSINEGYEWINISSNITQSDKKDPSKLVPVAGTNMYRDIIFDPTKDDGLLYANNAGLFWSDNGGNNWNQIKLISKQKGENIYAIGINPKNNKEIYYSTPNIFYKTFDGGKGWTTNKIKTTKTMIDMIIDVENPNNIFGAFKAI